MIELLPQKKGLFVQKAANGCDLLAMEFDAPITVSFGDGAFGGGRRLCFRSLCLIRYHFHGSMSYRSIVQPGSGLFVL
jgi:hypothetical protein